MRSKRNLPTRKQDDKKREKTPPKAIKSPSSTRSKDQILEQKPPPSEKETLSSRSKDKAGNTEDEKEGERPPPEADQTQEQKPPPTEREALSSRTRSKDKAGEESEEETKSSRFDYSFYVRNAEGQAFFSDNLQAPLYESQDSKKVKLPDYFGSGTASAFQKIKPSEKAKLKKFSEVFDVEGAKTDQIIVNLQNNSGKGSWDLTVEDLLTISGQSELNDAIMMYITHCQNQVLDMNPGPHVSSNRRVATFHSFFFVALCDDSTYAYNYNNVKKWGRKFLQGKSPMSFDSIVFILNFERHWQLVVLFPKIAKIELMCSLQRTNTFFCCAAYRWLHDEVNTYFPQELEGLLSLKFTISEQRYFGRQENFYDCGIFCILWILAIKHDTNPRAVTQAEAQKARQRLLLYLLGDTKMNKEENKWACNLIHPDFDFEMLDHSRVDPVKPTEDPTIPQANPGDESGTNIGQELGAPVEEAQKALENPPEESEKEKHKRLFLEQLSDTSSSDDELKPSIPPPPAKDTKSTADLEEIVPEVEKIDDAKEKIVEGEKTNQENIENQDGLTLFEDLLFEDQKRIEEEHGLEPENNALLLALVNAASNAEEAQIHTDHQLADPANVARLPDHDTHSEASFASLPKTPSSMNSSEDGKPHAQEKEPDKVSTHDSSSETSDDSSTSSSEGEKNFQYVAERNPATGGKMLVKKNIPSATKKLCSFDAPSSPTKTGRGEGVNLALAENRPPITKEYLEGIRERKRNKRMAVLARKRQKIFEKEEVERKAKELWNKTKNLFIGGKNNKRQGRLFQKMQEHLDEAWPAPRKKGKNKQKLEETLDQLCHLKYMRGTKNVERADQGFERIEGIWRNMYNTYQGKKQDGNVIPNINPRWCAEQFDANFLAYVREGTGYWIKIPAGRALQDTAPSDLLSNVPIKYMQESNAFCLTYSMASCLFYCGEYNAANAIHNLDQKMYHISQIVAIQKLRECIKKFCPQIGQAEVYNTHNRKNGPRKILAIDDLLNSHTPFPTLLILIGVDGSCNHAVTVVDDLVFDSTQAFAFKLKRESFDWICGKNGFKEFDAVYRFRYSSKKGAVWTRNSIVNW